MRYFRQYLIAAGARRPLAWYRNLGVSHRDVLIASYPKSGNTWLRAMLSSLVGSDIRSFHDFSDYVPEVERLHGSKRYRMDHGGRMIKTHEPYSARYKRAVYLVRDVRSVVVSYYFHQLRFNSIGSGLEPFFQSFIRSMVDGYGRWDYHVLSWLSAKDAGSCEILLLRYEDLVSEPVFNLLRVAEFIGLPTNTASVELAVRANTKDCMRQREEKTALPGRKDIAFVRKGVANEWQGILTTEQLRILVEEMGPLLETLGYTK